ncbi:MAG TPA: methyltransferase [Myxococcota bacterium]|nr:methyltransferase [Myxococcota bacterium]
MAWAYLVGFAATAVAALATSSPGLVAERSRLLAGGERDDVALSIAFFLLLYPGIWITCGLDRRFGASPELPLSLELAALALFLAGYAVALWAMHVNAFFSTMVRIQRERGHRVVDRGPYRFVRHPGYAGALLAHLALPVALGSLWGLVPAALGGAGVALRIVVEERTLRAGLAGYAEYASRVRWRLVPGVW